MTKQQLRNFWRRPKSSSPPQHLTADTRVNRNRLHIEEINKLRICVKVMAPKKGQKMSLNAFLEDSTLGSWADEMDALPTAPAPKADGELPRSGEFGRRGGDFLSSRPDRASFPPREEIPLPTQPPYTAFVGNLAFDLTEDELGAFFGPHETKSVKIIRDREDKPKGFGYVEFASLDGLKEAIAKSGSSFSSRTIRVSVAEPQKERIGGFGSADDDKFSGNWRRDGPLPDNGRPEREGGNRRRYEGQADPSSVADTTGDWRSSKATPRFPQDSNTEHGARRRGSGFSTPEHSQSAADQEESWTIGSRFKPSGPDSQSGSRFSSLRSRGDMAPPPLPDESDWRKARPGRNSTSPASSVPSTPQSGRRKLELLPRSSNPSTQPTPLSSPKSASHSQVTSRSNPFGDAKPVDVSAREAQVLQKIEKDREDVKEKVTNHAMSRQSSRQARDRTNQEENNQARSSDTAEAASPTPSNATLPTPSSPRPSISTVRPTFSFANAAAGRKGTSSPKEEGTQEENPDEGVVQTTERLAEVSI